MGVNNIAGGAGNTVRAGNAAGAAQTQETKKVYVHGESILFDGTLSGAELQEYVNKINPKVQLDAAKQYTQAEINALILPQTMGNEQETDTDLAGKLAHNYNTGLDWLANGMNVSNNQELTAEQQAQIETLKGQLIEQLKNDARFANKYSTGDVYSISNPELKNLNTFLDSGGIEEIEAAFKQAGLPVPLNTNVLFDIIQGAFNVGLSRKDNNLNVAYGHGNEAKAVYSKLIEKVSAATGSSAQILALEEQVKQKTAELNNNINNITILASKIETLEHEVRTAADKAKQDAKDIQEQFERDAQTAENEIKRQYENSQDTSSPMTEAQYASAMTQKIGSLKTSALTQMSSVSAGLTAAQTKVSSINSHVSSIKTLNAKNAQLRTDIADLGVQIAELKEKPKDINPNRIDPFGWTMQDKSGRQVKVDLYVDKDNDGKLSDYTEFLGAEKGKTEALNLAQDGTLSMEDLANHPEIMVYIASQDGSGDPVQMSAYEYFREQNVSIDFTTYKDDGSMDSFGNITAGTFDVNANGTKLEGKGYHTLDTVSYLDANYQFSDKDKGAGRFAHGEVQSVTAQTEIKAEEFEGLSAELQLLIDEANNTTIPGYKQKIENKNPNTTPPVIVKPVKPAEPEPEPEPITYEEYNYRKDWKEDIENLASSRSDRGGKTGLLSISFMRNLLLTRLSGKNYSPENTAECLKKILTAYNKAYNFVNNPGESFKGYTSVSSENQQDFLEQTAQLIVDKKVDMESIKNLNLQWIDSTDWISKLEEIVSRKKQELEGTAAADTE